MINVREYFRRKRKDEEALSTKISFVERIQGLRGKKISILFIGLMVIVLCALIGMGIVIYNQNHTYSGYSIVRSLSRDETSATNYRDFNGNILKYGLDGASCIDGKNNVLWNQPYSIQSPLVDICGTKAVIGARKENQIYVFDESGVIGQFQTLMPILKVKISSRGLVLAMLEDGDSVRFNLYDSDGELISEGKATINQTGYPLDIDISPDGGKLFFSYLIVEGGAMNSSIAIYDFDEVGQNYNENLIKSKTYKNTVIPQVEYLDNNTMVAFRDNGFSIFKGKVIPEESVNITIEDEIQSVFYSSNYISLVFQSDTIDEKYRIDIYDLNGNIVLSKDFSIEYTNIKMYDNQVIIFGGKDLSILTMKGNQKYLGEFDKNIQDIIKTDGFNRYTIITDSSVDEIKFH